MKNTNTFLDITWEEREILQNYLDSHVEALQKKYPTYNIPYNYFGFDLLGNDNTWGIRGYIEASNIRPVFIIDFTIVIEKMKMQGMLKFLK